MTTKPPPATLLDKARLDARRSTPDSEALASSDDEAERQAPENTSATSSVPVPGVHNVTGAATVITSGGKPPARRSSWLSEVQSLPPRRGSLAGASSHSPTSSHPTTPNVENPWVSGAAGGGGGGGVPGPAGPTASGAPPPPPSAGTRHPSATAPSFPWASGIWSSDARKEPPARLTEVLPSPTSMVPGAGAGLSPLATASDKEYAVSPGYRDSITESTIPFAIPLQPNVKTYRSQSYSVGQLDPESLSGGNPAHNLPNPYYHRGRFNHPSAVTNRPARPSMLGELYHHDGTTLGRVREAEDDDDGDSEGPEHDHPSQPEDDADDNLSGSQYSLKHSSPGGGKYYMMESLARENELLKREALTHQMENLQLRNRAASTHSARGGGERTASFAGVGHRIHGVVPEDAEYAIDEADDVGIDSQAYAKAMANRRFSEIGTDPSHTLSAFAFQHPRLDAMKKGHWQSSAGLGGGLAEGQQSRRHSFADVPKRSGSMSSAAASTDHPLGLSTSIGDLARGGQGENISPTDNSSYFGGLRPSPRRHHDEAYAQLGHGPHHAGTPRSPISAPNPNMYPSPAHAGMPGQPRPNQLLYVITFKCCRAEIFYIQEGTGLQVSPGDLVIVEADRGTDLGTVANADVTWTQAKELKEGYLEDHYRWLMMFSRHGQGGSGASGPGAAVGAGPGAGGGFMGASHNGSAVGGMGPPGAQGGPEHGAGAPSGEIRPKMIKRLAQSHEIQALRDKEGNEAKAKRVCQQKVQDHHLQMEILDAEFQMDWKKLTFYYFADAYINFNALVTDLFKIYKTRIWMSAINPASFANPSVAGLQPPSGIGPGALSNHRSSPFDQRQRQDSPMYGGGGNPGLNQYRPAFQSMSPSFEASPDPRSKPAPPSVTAPGPSYPYGFPAFGQVPRQERYPGDLGMMPPSYMPQYQ